MHPIFWLKLPVFLFLSSHCYCLLLAFMFLSNNSIICVMPTLAFVDYFYSILIELGFSDFLMPYTFVLYSRHYIVRLVCHAIDNNMF